MSNLTIVLTCVLISFLTSALFMSSYKEDVKDVLNSIISAGRNNAKLIKKLTDEISILRARVYDLENEIKEMKNSK